MTKNKSTKVLLVILALLTIQLNVFAQSVNGLDLIGYWPFSGNALDASGNNLNGINSGATLIADRNGNPNSAYYFDGTSASITVPHNQMLNAYPLTINFWFKTTQSTAGGNTGDNTFITKYQTGSGNGYKIATSQAHRIAPSYCTIGTNAGGNCYGGMTWGYDGNWHMATVVFSVDTIGASNTIVPTTAIYVDNVLADSVSGFGSIQATTNTRDLLFGKADNSNPFLYEGALDDISIWGKALTQLERTALFNGTATISGINDERTEATGSVYPNPATDQITIDSESTQNTSYSILDLTGRIVSEGKLESGSKTLSISTLQKGIYMVRIGDDQKQQLFKLFKQ